MRKGRLKGRSGQPALTFFPTASVGPSVLSTCISKPGPSGRPIRKKSPVDSLIDPLLSLTSCPPRRDAPPPDLFWPPPRPRGLRLVTERVEIRVYAHRLVVRCQGEGEGEA